MLLRSVLLLSCLIAVSSASRILCYFPNPSRSHVLLALPVCEKLAQKGHHVTTVVSYHFNVDGGPTYREVVIKTRGLYGSVRDAMSGGRTGSSPSFFVEVTRQFQEDALEAIRSPEFQKILAEDKFDLVFFIPVFSNNFQLGIADHFKAPWVGLSPMGNMFFTRELLGQQTFVSTVPTKMSSWPTRMNFLQRTANFFAHVVEFTFTKYLELSEASHYAALWPSPKYRSLSEMKKNNSVMFFNGHWTESKVIRPTLPNEVDIGGIQINAHPKPLEPEIQKYLDEAKDGVVLFTFGSNLPINTVDPAKLDIILRVLGKLKQRVVIKWDSDDTSKLPKNFLARKWLSQTSILAHKNVRLFITHGGHGGSMEAMYHEVPILGIPFFGDQPTNVAKATADGWALGTTITDLTEEDFSRAINDLLTNPKYQQKVKEMSAKYKDRIAHPLDEALFWVEYVLKHHGAPQLSYAGKELNFFQYYCLDVIAVSLTVLYVVIMYSVAIFRIIFRKLFGRSSPAAGGKDKVKRKKRD